MHIRAVRAVSTISFIVLAMGPAVSLATGTELVSARRVDLPQISGNGPSSRPAFSENGRFIAFQSGASNLLSIPAVRAFITAVYVYDRSNGGKERVSVSNSGAQANSHSEQAAISADGRYVAFLSFANNLVPGVPGGDPRFFFPHVYVRDRVAGTTSVVSISSTGAQQLFPDAPHVDPLVSGISISADGRYVVFSSNAWNLSGETSPLDASMDVFLRDRVAGTTRQISVSPQGAQGNGNSTEPAISSDGRYIAFSSDASNLVANDTYPGTDIFVHGTQTGATTLINVNASGTQVEAESGSPSISGDGRYVAFQSLGALVSGDTNNRRDIFLRDRTSSTTTRVSVSSSGGQANGDSEHPFISARGRFVVFMSLASNLVPNDTNASTDPLGIKFYDVFIRDLQAGTTKRSSVTGSSTQASGSSRFPVTNGDGNYVAFESTARNLVSGDENSDTDVFLRNRNTSTTSLLSSTTAFSQTAFGRSVLGVDHGLSRTGRLVVFSSRGSTLVPNDTNDVEDIFVRDRLTHTTTRVSVSSSGAQGNRDSSRPVITPNGRYVAFASFASNLVAGDTNNSNDIFVHDRTTRATTRVSVATSGAQSTGFSTDPVISDDGRYVAFSSPATNFDPIDTNEGASDIYVRDRTRNTTSMVSIPTAGGVILRFRASESPSMSADGRYVAFVNESEGFDPRLPTFGPRVYVHDRQTRQTTWEGDSATLSFQPKLSADARFLVYTGFSPQGTRTLFLKDRLIHSTAQFPIEAIDPAISANGRYVVFASDEPGIVASDTDEFADVFLLDRESRAFSLVTVDSGPVGGHHSFPTISADGSTIAFHSTDLELVVDDGNLQEDVFVRARVP